MKTHPKKLPSILQSLLFVPFIASLCCTGATAQTRGVDIKYHTDGTLKLFTVPAARFPQSTRDNCGPCAANSALSAEVYKRLGFHANITESSLKVILDDDDSTGVSVDEMEDGIEDAASKLSQLMNLTGSNRISRSWSEKIVDTDDRSKASTSEMSTAFSDIQYWMARSKSAVLLSGNMDIFWTAFISATPWNKRGDHWYAVRGFGNEKDGRKYVPYLLLNDSVYDSPAFKSSERKYAVSPNTIIYSAKARDLWRPTGPRSSPALRFVVNTLRPN